MPRISHTAQPPITRTDSMSKSSAGVLAKKIGESSNERLRYHLSRLRVDDGGGSERFKHHRGDKLP